MTNWKNLDTLDSYKALKACKGSVDLTTVMAGESGADRAKNYSVPMAEKLTYNFAAKEVMTQFWRSLQPLPGKQSLLTSSRSFIMVPLSIQERTVWFFIR